MDGFVVSKSFNGDSWKALSATVPPVLVRPLLGSGSFFRGPQVAPAASHVAVLRTAGLGKHAVGDGYGSFVPAGLLALKLDFPAMNGWAIFGGGVDKRAVLNSP